MVNQKSIIAGFSKLFVLKSFNEECSEAKKIARREEQCFTVKNILTTPIFLLTTKAVISLQNATSFLLSLNYI